MPSSLEKFYRYIQISKPGGGSFQVPICPVAIGYKRCKEIIDKALFSERSATSHMSMSLKSINLRLSLRATKLEDYAPKLPRGSQLFVLTGVGCAPQALLSEAWVRRHLARMARHGDISSWMAYQYVITEGSA